jgi:4-amino-4-deoxy-L-arabinose transferase-like glycosyltransferase
LGFPTGRSSTSTPHHQQVFWRRYRGERRLLQGESRTHNLLLCFALLYFFLHLFIKNTKKKLVPFIVVIFVGLLLPFFIIFSINGWFL